MRRRLNPWVVALTAALTFGSLMAFVGPRSFRNGHFRNQWFHDRSYGYHHDRCDGYGSRDQPRNGFRSQDPATAPDTDSIQ